ncbi:MAG: ABC transporter ATP-binding protein [Eubacteriales bacterium]|nr:ABC transporter ATP-binding protein [Eubacteriales bacterium]
MAQKKSNNANSSSNKTLSKVLHYIGQYKFLLVLSVILAAVTVILTLYVPILFGDAIDDIVAKGQVDFDLIAFYMKRIAVLVILTAVLQWLMNTVNNRITYHIVRDIRAKAFRRIQILPLSYLDGHSTGDIVSRVIADVDQFTDGLLMGFTQLFTGVVTIVATLVFMLSKSVPITVLVVLLTPISFLVARFIATRTFHMFRMQSETRGKQTALTEEMIGNQKVVKAFGYEERAKERFAAINRDLETYSLKAVFYSSLTNPATRCVNSLIYAAVALVGAFFVIGGTLTVGGLSVLLSYANQYTKPFNDISSVITELQNALACASRVFELIEQEPQTPDAPEVLPSVQGDVELKNVFFSYDKNKRLIEDFSIHAKPGMRIAIVGPTGCGKTTLINLLMRFYDADSGSIHVDGTNIYDVTRHSLRANYGMVLQETWLKNATVRENITIGKPDATEEELITAAKEAHSYEFIRRLPDGFDTVLTDDSVSQGQKQLLCITRVMLCLPPMLILDEATSSIDTRTELQIQEAFQKMMKGRTSFIVAHRLSTIRTADVIIVMNEGHIIEQGNHETLLNKGGFYAKLYNSQFAR